MTNDPSNNSPDFDPDATIEQSETEIDAHQARHAHTSPLPESIGKYRIFSEIGEGGDGNGLRGRAGFAATEGRAQGHQGGGGEQEPVAPL